MVHHHLFLIHRYHLVCFIDFFFFVKNIIYLDKKEHSSIKRKTTEVIGDKTFLTNGKALRSDSNEKSAYDISKYNLNCNDFNYLYLEPSLNTQTSKPTSNSR